MAEHNDSKPVKLSGAVIGFLNNRRGNKGGRKESYDSVLRRYFGLPTQRGKPQRLKTYFVLDNDGSPLIFTRKADAAGEAVILAVRRKGKQPDPVITVRGAP
jgi:hypothetical protein